MCRSLHHAKQGVKLIHMNRGGLSAKRREFRRGASAGGKAKKIPLVHQDALVAF